MRGARPHLIPCIQFVEQTSPAAKRQAVSWGRRKPANVGEKVSGRHGEGETPVPIPNTAVKPLSADGTVSVDGMGE